MKTSRRRITRATAALCAVIAALCSAGALAAPNVTTTVITSNEAPIAENLELTTYRGIAVTGAFSAVDPEGETVVFEVTREPKRGSVVMLDANTFLYTPADTKKSSDEFLYAAVDASGNISADATVRISIKKQDTAVAYADMDGSKAAYAALALAENGVFIGDTIGSQQFFRPGESVTRGEFLAMCLAVSDAELLEGVTRTGFFDDEDISPWAKPYVSTALMSGIISGYKNGDGRLVFAPDEPIKFAEAAVMLNNALHVTDVMSVSAINSDVAPAWAYQSVANLYSCGVITQSIEEDYSEIVTREDAALMLVSALKLTEAREGYSLLGWAK